jgi:YidC/Oxa1 family membrane protein insertase
MGNSRNLILAIALSVAILLAFDFYTSYERSKLPPPAPVAAGQAVTQARAPGAPRAVSPPGTPGTTGGALPRLKSRAQVLAQTPRIKIETPRLDGSISLKGGRIDDLTLATYRKGLAPDSPPITLLSPPGSKGAYFADFGWVAGGGEDVPGPDTVWTADRDTLTPSQPVTLTWDNGKGLTFSRVYALDDKYMFTITQRVSNTGSARAVLSPYGLVSRHGTPRVSRYFILFEGMLGVFDGKLKDVKYKSIRKDAMEKQTSTGGWIGFTDKYWLSALIPDPKEKTTTRFIYTKDGNQQKYQVDYLGPKKVLAAGTSIKTINYLFTGAKEIKVLDRYEETIGITRFDLAIDFGWFYFLTKPIFYLLIIIHSYVGNFGIAILLLTVFIKALLFPLANKSYKSMSKMKKLQPEIVKLRERFGDDKARINQEMMALYKREKANPASGCLPMLIQIPVFFSLYKVLFVTIEMRQAPFFGWIHDLSVPDPTNVFNLFGLIPWDPASYLPAFMMIGVWPLIMGITMFLQQKLNPKPTDPIQAKVFMFLPIIFTFLLAKFPAGLVIYWAWNNTLSIIQQKIIMIRMGVK